jgi:hypothetical protein
MSKENEPQLTQNHQDLNPEKNLMSNSKKKQEEMYYLYLEKVVFIKEIIKMTITFLFWHLLQLKKYNHR